MHATLVALLVALALATGTGQAADLVARLAAANPDRGAKIFRKCVACHSVEKGGPNSTGPNLWGILGADVATREGFRYSRAMKALTGSWTPERLDVYLLKPRELVKGSSMTFVGLKRERDRADLIAFLNTKSDDPIDFGPQVEDVAVSKGNYILD